MTEAPNTAKKQWKLEDHIPWKLITIFLLGLLVGVIFF
jgi:hypothetical protein